MRRPSLEGRRAFYMRGHCSGWKFRNGAGKCHQLGCREFAYIVIANRSANKFERAPARIRRGGSTRQARRGRSSASNAIIRIAGADALTAELATSA